MQDVQIAIEPMVGSGVLNVIAVTKVSQFSAVIVIPVTVGSVASVLSVGNASLHAIPAPTLIKEKEELALCV